MTDKDARIAEAGERAVLLLGWEALKRIDVISQLEASRERCLTRAEHAEQEVARLREALERIRDGRWNLHRHPEKLNVYEFAREALSEGRQ